GLAAAHAQGLVHRDIKPANLWIEPEYGGRIKILDFGLVQSAQDASLTASGTVLGTPAYMAPEQARGGKVDPRSDPFSPGVVLYRLGTGRLPFTGKGMMAVLTSLAVDTPPDPRVVENGLPPQLAELIMQLLAKDPQMRPASALAVAERLGE